MAFYIPLQTNWSVILQLYKFIVKIDLQNKKLNVSNETIRKFEDRINIELQTKITQLNEKIDTLNFKKSEQNLSNSKLIGDYIVNDYPVKPKKSLTIAVSFVTGFILSIFLVFILNFFRKA
jgi:capsular polysaccharide biosynthesis protein